MSGFSGYMPVSVNSIVFTVPSGQWSGSGSDYYFTVQAPNVTTDSMLDVCYDNASKSLFSGTSLWVVASNGSFTVHVDSVPAGDVTIKVRLEGVVGEAQYQVLSDVYSKSQTYSKSEVYTKTETNSAISQSTASVSNISFFSETTWSQIYAKLKTALNDKNRAIALITVYSGAVSSILTANNYGGYLKGYVTVSGSDGTLYDFFAGALSTGDMFAWRVTASDSAPTISNFRRYVDSESIKAEFPVSYVNIGAENMLKRIAQMSDGNMIYFRTTGTTTGQPGTGMYLIGAAIRAGNNISVRATEMDKPEVMYQNSTTDAGSTWKGWKKFTGTAV